MKCGANQNERKQESKRAKWQHDKSFKIFQNMHLWEIKFNNKKNGLTRIIQNKQIPLQHLIHRAMKGRKERRKYLIYVNYLEVFRAVKGVIHQKKKRLLLSPFTNFHVVLNLHEFLSSTEHKRRYFEECWFWWQLTSIVWIFLQTFFYVPQK